MDFYIIFPARMSLARKLRIALAFNARGLNSKPGAPMPHPSRAPA
jgi:hypothetical protein